jgi:hypothetical protein
MMIWFAIDEIWHLRFEFLVASLVFPSRYWVFGVFLWIFQSEFIYLFGLVLHVLWPLRKVSSYWFWQISHEHKNLSFWALWRKPIFEDGFWDVFWFWGSGGLIFWEKDHITTASTTSLQNLVRNGVDLEWFCLLERSSQAAVQKNQLSRFLNPAELVWAEDPAKPVSKTG